MTEPPLIISVDDHVVEPPDLWQSRLPATLPGPRPAHRAPEDEPRRGGEGGAGWRCAGPRPTTASGATSGTTTTSCRPFMMLSAAVGFEEVGFSLTTFDDDPPGRLEAGGAARRHGRQPRRGRHLLPQHPAPLLRADLLEREDKELALPVRAGLQRLDDRRVVGRRRPGHG